MLSTANEQTCEIAQHRKKEVIAPPFPPLLLIPLPCLKLNGLCLRQEVRQVARQLLRVLRQLLGTGVKGSACISDLGKLNIMGMSNPSLVLDRATETGHECRKFSPCLHLLTNPSKSSDHRNFREIFFSTVFTIFLFFAPKFF